MHPAYVNLVPGSATIAAAGVGLGTNGQVAAGLGVSILGSAFIPAGGVRGYGSTPTYLALDLKFTLGSTSGPQHVIISQGSGIYVLPSGAEPGAEQSTFGDGRRDRRRWECGGDRFEFQIRTARFTSTACRRTTNVTDGSHATAIPPPGASSQTVAVTVFNSDGQSSMFYGPSPVPTYSYPSAARLRRPESYVFAEFAAGGRKAP